tara:strand:- start:1468 stop:1629 length:162 start_codon:yes stop_codon:yes gene_type:complete
MRHSRNDWKEKAKNRADEIREFRKKITKNEQKIIELEAKLARTYQSAGSKKKI